MVKWTLEQEHVAMNAVMERVVKMADPDTNLAGTYNSGITQINLVVHGIPLVVTIQADTASEGAE